jgi:RNA polymerase sigma-70 factor (ECF subfamily)
MNFVVSKGKVRKLGDALSDEELWRAFAGGDDSAYTLLYFRYADRIYSYLRLLLGSGPERHYIEDVFQETWIRVYKEKEKFEIREGGTFSGWVFRISHNKAISLVRRPHYVSSFNELGSEEQILNNFSSTSTHEILSDHKSVEEVIVQLRAVVEELPIAFKEVYLLSEFEHMNMDQITEMLGISKANAKVRLFRARRMVRQRMMGVLDIDAVFSERDSQEEIEP